MIDIRLIVIAEYQGIMHNFLILKDFRQTSADLFHIFEVIILLWIFTTRN